MKIDEKIDSFLNESEVGLEKTYSRSTPESDGPDIFNAAVGAIHREFGHNVGQTNLGRNGEISVKFTFWEGPMKDKAYDIWWRPKSAGKYGDNTFIWSISFIDWKGRQWFVKNVKSLLAHMKSSGVEYYKEQY